MYATEEHNRQERDTRQEKTNKKVNKLDKKVEAIKDTVYQLLGGLFNQRKQSHMLAIYLAHLNQTNYEDVNISEYDKWPTTRQGDVLESRMNAMELRMIQLEKENAEKTQKIATLERNNSELQEVVQHIGKWVCKHDTIEGDISDLKEALREIGARLLNQVTQKGAWRELREMFYHDETFTDMDEDHDKEWSTNTSKWGKTFTTPQGDDNEARIARIEEKMKQIFKAF